MDDPLRGIVYHSADGTLAHLPLTQVRVKVFMVDGNVIHLRSQNILHTYVDVP